MIKVINIELLGKMVRDTRKKQALTQEQLAATCGFGVRFIRELEKGKPSCQSAKVLHVLSMLGLEVYIKDLDDDLGRD